MNFKKNLTDIDNEEKMNNGCRKPNPREKDYQMVVQCPLGNGASHRGLQSEGATSTWARKPTLDLQQQAQVAACTYLGVDPNETKYLSRIKQQGLLPDPFRPMEVHLHHHHHHYVNKSSKMQTGSQILRADVPVSVENSLSKSSHLIQSQKIPTLSFDSTGLSRKSLQSATFMRSQVLDQNDLEATKFKPTLHMDYKDLSRHDVFSSKGDSLSCPSGSSQQMALTFKSFSHSNRIGQNVYSSGFGSCISSEPSEGNIPTRTSDLSTKVQSPCLQSISYSLTEDMNLTNLDVPGTIITHGKVISFEEKKRSLTALSEEKLDDCACWSSTEFETRNGASPTKRTEIWNRETEDHNTNFLIAQKGAGTVCSTHFERQISPSPEKSPVHSYLRSSVGALVSHDCTPSLEDIDVTSLKTTEEVMCRMKSQGHSDLNTCYASDDRQIDTTTLKGEQGQRPFFKSNEFNKRNSHMGALHNPESASSHGDIHVASLETAKYAGEVIDSKKMHRPSSPKTHHCSPVYECNQVDADKERGEREQWRSYIKSYEVDKMSDHILQLGGFMGAQHTCESVPYFENPCGATPETALPAGEEIYTKYLQETSALNSQQTSPFNEHIGTTIVSGEQGRWKHFGKSCKGDNKNDQILLTDEFYQKTMKESVPVDNFENRDSPCKDRELIYESKQLKSGNKAQHAAEEKFYASLASAKAVEDKLRILMDGGSSFHTEFERNLDGGQSDKLRQQKVPEQDNSNEGSKENDRDLLESMDGLGERSNKMLYKGKPQVESLPISVGALQVEHSVTVNVNEGASNAAQDEAHISAAEDKLAGLIDERDKCVAKFERELVHRSWNKHRSQQWCESGTFMSEASRNNPGDMKPKSEQPSMMTGSFSPDSQLSKPLMLQCELLEINDNIRNKSMKAEIPSIPRNVNVLHDSVKHAEEQLFNLLNERARFHTKFEEALKQGSSGSLKLQELLDMEKLKHESSKKELEKMKRNFDSFWNSRLESIHEPKGTITGVNFQSKSPAKEHEEEKVFNEREACACEASDKEVKERYECLVREKGKHGLDFEAQLEFLDADRGRLQKLLELEKSKSKASQKELQELKLEVGEILIKEESERVREDSSALERNAGSCVEKLGEEKICSRRSSNEGKENIFFSSDNLRITEGNAACLSESLGSMNNVPFFMTEEAHVKTGLNTPIIKLLHQQELAWKATEDTVESLERRLKLLEYDKVKLEDTIEKMQSSSQTRHDMENVQTKLEEKDWEGDILKRYTCIYQSPVFEDPTVGIAALRRSNGMGQHPKSVIFAEHGKTEPNDHKDIEIAMLKEEIAKLRSQISRSGEKMCSDSHGLHHKAGAIQGMPKSLCIDSISKLQQGSSLQSCFPNGLPSLLKKNAEVDKQDKSVYSMPNFGEQNDKTSQNDSLSITGEDAVDKSIIVDKTVLAQGETNESPVNVLHCSFENMVHAFNETESIHGEMSEDDTASLEGELKILKGAVRKLAEICQEQQIRLTEFKIGKHLQSLHGKSYLNVLRDLYVNLLKDMSKQLGSLNKQLKMNSFEIEDDETEEVLKQQIEKSEAQVTALNKCLEGKIECIKEMSEKMQAVQNETDTALMEKFELLLKIQVAQKESDDQKDRIKELVSINEDLLLFAQAKESELSRMKKEIETVKQMIAVKLKENTMLIQDLADTRREVEKLKDSENSLKNSYKLLKSKLVESEYELSQREEAIERLTKHLASTIEGQDCLLEEDEQLQFSLKEAHYKEQELDEQLQQSQRIIQELEDKLSSLGSEIWQTRAEITDMKEQNVLMKRAVEGKGLKALSMQKEAGEIRQRVLQLEDEIMEKEGQIAILKSSYPGDNEF